MRIPLQISVILPLLVAAIVFCGCGRSPEREALERAEAVMEERPDSALAIVGALRLDSAAPAADRALHALLLVQAMHKNDLLNEPDSALLARCDSLTAFAADYYDREYDRTRLMKSLYYSGTVKYMNPDSLSAALLPLHESLELAEEMDDPFWTAKGYEGIANVCYFAGAYADQARMQEKVLENYRKSGREEFVRYADFSIGLTLLNADAYRDAISHTFRVRKEAEERGDTVIWTASVKVLAKAYFFIQDYGATVREIETLDSRGLHDHGLDVFHAVASVLSGNVEKARVISGTCAEELDTLDRVRIRHAIAGADGDESTRLRMLELLYADEVEQTSGDQSIDLNSAHVEAIHRASGRHSRQRASAGRRSVAAICSLTVVIVLMVCGFRRFRKRMEGTIHGLTVEKRRMSMELEGRSKENGRLIENLRNGAEELRGVLDDNRRLKRELHDMEMRHVLEKDSLRKEAGRRQQLTREVEERPDIAGKHGQTPRGTPSSLSYMVRTMDRIALWRGSAERKGMEIDSNLLSELNSLTEIFKPGREIFIELERMADEVHVGIIRNLRTECPNLTERNHALALYMICGFSNEAICLFLGATPSQLKAYKVDLRKKIRRMPDETRVKYSLLLEKRGSQGERRRKKDS